MPGLSKEKKTKPDKYMSFLSSVRLVATTIPIIYVAQSAGIIPCSDKSILYLANTERKSATSIGIIYRVIYTRLEKISVCHDMFCRQEWPLQIIDGEIIPAAYANYCYGSMGRAWAAAARRTYEETRI